MEESSESIGISSVSHATTAQNISELLNDDPVFASVLADWLYKEQWCFSKDEQLSNKQWLFSKDERLTLIHLIRLCTLFPKDYDLDIGQIVQLLSAQTGAVWKNKFEDLVNRWFYVLLSKQLLQPSYCRGHLRYKLNEHVYDVVEKNSHSHTDKMHAPVEDNIGSSDLPQSPRFMEKTINNYLASTKKRYARVEDNIDTSSLSQSTNYASLLFSTSSSDNISSRVEKFQVISNTCPYLDTLLLLGTNRSLIDQIPGELCLKLKYLRVLDLSYTSIRELPSSFAKLKLLRYLDVSGTLITQLPNSICFFRQMQTLKLRDCLKLIKLPKEIRRLDGLVHLDLNIAYQLNSMPPGLGNLTKLQTLPAFIVGKEAGCGIGELQHMTDIRGDLSILRLENVHQDAKKAALNKKMYIEKLELQWTDSQDGFEVLESLQPHTNIKELRIVGYEGAKFPYWFGDPCYDSLKSITLCDCTCFEIFPSLGMLPQLENLYIGEMRGVAVINHQLCNSGPIGGALFPCLNKLVMHRLPDLEKWVGIKEGDFGSLHSLKVSCCPKLRALPELQLLSSLKHLEISNCCQLHSLEIEGPTPCSLVSLLIIDSPMLKKRYSGAIAGEDQRNISYIHHVFIE